jgi:integral membrane protein
VHAGPGVGRFAPSSMSTPPSPPVNRVFLRRLRWLGLVEGCSTLLLFFVAMPLKYAADMPMAVTIVGSAHGFLFIALCLMMVLGRAVVPLPDRLVAAGILGAIVPFGPFVVDRHLVRLGQAGDLGEASSAPATPPVRDPGARTDPAA